MTIPDALVDRVARALGAGPGNPYTTPIVYPWAVQNFAPRPLAERNRPPAGAPVRLYVHVPFCNYHCTFCFYAVRTGAKRHEMERYVAALERELSWLDEGTPLSRLTVGGGTPTALPPELLDRVLTGVFGRLRATPDAAHTVEASPDSLTDAHVAVLERHGIGRVSIGVESMDDGILGEVQRRHTPAQALAACRLIVEAGLSLNVDLIYGLPRQTEDSFRRDLELVAAAGAATLCLYGLRLNERTVVATQLADAERLDLARTMRWRAFVTRAAADAGFVQTRSYTFRRAGAGPGWHERPAAAAAAARPAEVGIGMSARSQIGAAAYRNTDRNELYMQRVEAGQSPVESVFDLEPHDLRTQFIAGTLANGRPLVRAAYAAAFAASFDADYAPLPDRLREAGLLADDGDRIALTDLGRLVYDRVLLCFYSARARGWLGSRPPVRGTRAPAAGAS